MPPQNPNCPFCAIARKDAAAHVVFENDEILAFLDIMPIRPEHTQIIPKVHFGAIENIPPEVLNKLMGFAQSLVWAMKAIYGVPMREAAGITSRQYMPRRGSPSGQRPMLRTRN